ncbi:MAG: hypothetical protein A2X23_04835 [Chloroflexi bacterium GWC2_73_18]|nr:MAG: hypothetical protein A2X23_04835 [Chloroflexi bacterium GWC2_73_18]
MGRARSSSIVHLELSRSFPVGLGRACEVLSGDELDWLGLRVAGDDLPTGTRRYQTDLSLPIRGRSPQMVLRKAAFVELGAVRSTDVGCQLEISWRSATLAPLFPVFVGHLSVAADEIRLEGYYAPPGGDLGLVLDRALLGIAARGTARWFLERVALALGDGVPMTERAPALVRTAGETPGRPPQPRLSRASGDSQDD